MFHRSEGDILRYVRALLIAVLMTLLMSSCGGERANGPDGNGPEEAAATEGTQAVAAEKEIRASTDTASAGGRVETCGGGGGRLKRFGYTPKGYRYWKVGGNIAWHSGPEPEPEAMFEGWMDSPGHRANILDEDFRQIGIGTYAGQYEGYEDSVMYTADFGVRRR